MKTLVEQLAQYGAYHRDRRNILTHFIGIPMIVVAVTVLLARPTVALGAFAVSPALLAAALTTLYYLRLDLRYGGVMGSLLALSVAFAHGVAVGTTATWLATGLGLFVVGWVLQFIGHCFEGRKPAFVDDLMGLIIGPLFVVAEAGFSLGLRPEVQAAVEARCGPVRSV
jgi:uncharacterized membrane protein YGL010W